jgi:putative flippase GtrA
MQFLKTPKVQEFLRFTYLGFFLRVVTFIANYSFVDLLHWNKDLSFGLVMLIDFIITFYISFYYVFKPRGYGQDSLKSFLIKSLVSGIILRAFNWWIYSWLLEMTPIHYLWIQFWTTTVVFFMKFLVFSLIFKSR